MSALDREKASRLIRSWDQNLDPTSDLLDALEACVVPDPPTTIDRDTLIALFGDSAYAGTKVWDERERLASDVFALWRPAAGVALTKDEAALLGSHIRQHPPGLRRDLRDLGKRLEEEASA